MKTLYVVYDWNMKIMISLLFIDGCVTPSSIVTLLYYEICKRINTIRQHKIILGRNACYEHCKLFFIRIGVR